MQLVCGWFICLVNGIFVKKNNYDNRQCIDRGYQGAQGK